LRPTCKTAYAKCRSWRD